MRSPAEARQTYNRQYAALPRHSDRTAVALAALVLVTFAALVAGLSWSVVWLWQRVAS